MKKSLTVAAAVLAGAIAIAPTAAFAGWTSVDIQCPIDKKTTVEATGHSKHGANMALKNALDEVKDHGYSTATCVVA